MCGAEFGARPTLRLAAAIQERGARLSHRGVCAPQNPAPASGCSTWMTTSWKTVEGNKKLKVGFLTIVAMLQRLSREGKKTSQQFCLRAGRYAKMTLRNYHPFRVHQLDPASKSRLSTLESPLFMFTACRYHIQLVASNLRHLNACDWEYKSICIICDETFFYNCIYRRT